MSEETHSQAALSQPWSVLLGISVFWVALSMLFDGLNVLVLPVRLANLTDHAHRATFLGLLTSLGLLGGMLVMPMAGAASDRLRPRWGRRGMLTLGVLLIFISLAAFGLSQSLMAVAISFLLVHAAASIAQAAQQGFIPDLIPASQRGLASGLKGFMDLGGALLGFAVLGKSLARGGTWISLSAISVVTLVLFLLTLILAREQSRILGSMSPFSPAAAFRLDVRKHRIFVQLVGSRFLFLLGTYAVGRFFLFFVSDRLALPEKEAAVQAGGLLAALTLVTVLAGPPAGKAADRYGRRLLMLLGAAASALGVSLLIAAHNSLRIFLFGSLMALGSAAFSAANWAFTADVVPPEEAARFFGLANIGTVGAAAAAGLFGPLIDWVDSISPGTGYSALFMTAAAAFVASTLVLRPLVSGVKSVRVPPQARSGTPD